MKFRTATLSLVIAGMAVSAQAHTHLTSSVPADKSRVKAPTALELNFPDPVKLTALTLKKGSDAEIALKPLPAAAAKHLLVPVSALAAGEYVVNWRMVGDDGHVMSGKFAFTVDPNAPAAPGAARETPAGDHSHKH